MDLANLNAFIAIAEAGSFSEAAERLHLTQPAVSKRIAGLEQQLDTRLFDRLGREVSLTEAGRALLPRAYQILYVLDDTRRALTNLNGEVSGRLTLATSHHIGLHRLPALKRGQVASLAEHGPDLAPGTPHGVRVIGYREAMAELGLEPEIV